MGNYKANAKNTWNFSLTEDSRKIGDLAYEKWYSFKAEIKLSGREKYKLEPKGFWDSKIELTDGRQSLLEFKMGWKGILINSFFEGEEKTYLLKLKGLLSNQYILLDTDQEELLVAQANFKWKKLTFDFDIETSEKFEGFEHKELLLLTILHCINYYMTISAG